MGFPSGQLPTEVGPLAGPCQPGLLVSLLPAFTNLAESLLSLEWDRSVGGMGSLGLCMCVHLLLALHMPPSPVLPLAHSPRCLRPPPAPRPSRSTWPTSPRSGISRSATRSPPPSWNSGHGLVVGGVPPCWVWSTQTPSGAGW